MPPESNSNFTLILFLVALVSFLAGWGFVTFVVGHFRRRGAMTDAEAIRERAQLEVANRKKEAELEIKENMLRQRTDLEAEIGKFREELREKERQLDRREELLNQKADHLQKQERAVEGTQRRLTEKLSETERRGQEMTKLLDIQRQTLHELSGLNRQEATTRLLTLLDQELQHETGNLILRYRKKVEDSSKEQAREILLTALQRYAAAHTAEATTSTIGIPNDEVKGRIIGREGRNIRAFEKETGVDVIIDDTPGVVVVSAFDPVRREVARLALSRLIADGRIHPSRIEEIVAETRNEVENIIRKKGEEACHEVNIAGLHERLIFMLGRLHFRTSYSQNVLRHSVEVAFASGMMAEMIGLDGNLARRCGLLHDIGKAADHEMEGGHPKIGADLLKRHGENAAVVHAAFGHHDEIVTEYPYTMLVAAADACSASRPGARRETLERYIKRMEELEAIANKFEGVEQAFAVQAGRELRVIANARQTDDATAARICHDIAKAFEEQLTYPGEIKVTLIRESRFTEVAR